MYITFFFLLLFLIYVSIIDIVSYKIANLSCLLIVIAGISSNYFLSNGIGLSASLVGLFAGFMPMLLIHFLTGIGAGDVKLMGAIGSLTGHTSVLAIFYYSFVISGVIAMIYLVNKRCFSRHKQSSNTNTRIANLAVTVANTESRSVPNKLPMAPGITLASWYVLLPQISVYSIAIKTGF